MVKDGWEPFGPREGSLLSHTHSPQPLAHISRASPSKLREILFLQWSSFLFPLSQQRQTAQFASRCNNQSAFRESQKRKHLNSSRWGLKTLAPKMKATGTKKHFQDFIRLNRDIRVRFLSITSSKKMISLPVNGSAHGSLLWLSHKRGDSDCVSLQSQLGNQTPACL